MQNLPRSKGSPQILLSGPVWDRAADELERQANLKVASPLELTDNSSGRLLSLRTRPDRLYWGRIVCSDDSGTPDFSDNRYHVSLGYLSNTQSDPLTARVNVTTYPTGDPRHKIVTATNLFENNDQTHNVRPDTIVRAWADFDAGSPPILRWSMLVADEGAENAAPCQPASSASSSSSSNSQSSSSSTSQSSASNSSGSQSQSGTGSGSSGQSTSSTSNNFCTFVYHCDVTCTSAGPDVGPVVFDGVLCNPITGQPANQWFVTTGVTDVSCRLLYNRVTATPCTTNGDCPEEDPNPAPDAPQPSDYAPCCSQSAASNSSGSSSSGSGQTQSITVVTAFDPTSCTVTTQTLHFKNGLLTSVTD